MSAVLKPNSDQEAPSIKFLETPYLNQRDFSWFLLLGFIGGGFSVAFFASLAFPGVFAAPSFMTLAGYLGITAPVLTLLAIGIVGGLLTAELLIFLALKLNRVEAKNHIFIRNLLISLSLLNGILLGIFLVAASPSVANTFSFGFAQSALGAATPYCFASLFITLAIIVIGLVMYTRIQQQLHAALISSIKVTPPLQKVAIEPIAESAPLPPAALTLNPKQAMEPSPSVSSNRIDSKEESPCMIFAKITVDTKADFEKWQEYTATTKDTQKYIGIVVGQVYYKNDNELAGAVELINDEQSNPKQFKSPSRPSSSPA